MFLTQTFQIDALSIIILVGIIAFVVFGIVKGFFKMLIDLFSSVVSAIISIFLAKPVGLFIFNTGCFNKLIVKSNEFLISKNTIFSTIVTEENKSDLISQALTEFNISSRFNTIISAIGAKILPNTDGKVIGEYVATALFVAISIAIAGILMFLAITIIVKIAELFFHKLDKIKPIRKANHTLGGVVGLVNGIIFALIVIVVFSLLLMIPGINEQLGSIIKLHDDNIWTIGEMLYKLDILGILLKLIGF